MYLAIFNKLILENREMVRWEGSHWAIASQKITPLSRYHFNIGTYIKQNIVLHHFSVCYILYYHIILTDIV